MSDEIWKDNNIQFPRLLAEINAIGLTDKQYLDLGSSMDLARWEIDELFNRAETQWRRHKINFLGTPDLPLRKRTRKPGTNKKPQK